MAFALLPAVDVADGRAVRLVQGEAGTATTRGDPRQVALAWQAGGAEWVHLVDLDAAFGRGTNAELLAAVIGELDVEVQLSGGICDDASLERALSTGCGRVVLGSSALEDPTWCSRVIAAHGERIAVGLDVRVAEHGDGSALHQLAARGRTADGGDLWDTVGRLDRDGCARYVVTDVGRDGTLHGPNVDLHRAVTHATAAPVIASGGVSALGDLVVLAEAAAAGANVEGSIVGTALQAGRFTLPEALQVMRRVEAARADASGRSHLGRPTGCGDHRLGGCGREVRSGVALSAHRRRRPGPAVEGPGEGALVGDLGRGGQYRRAGRTASITLTPPDTTGGRPCRPSSRIATAPPTCWSSARSTVPPSVTPTSSSGSPGPASTGGSGT